MYRHVLCVYPYRSELGRRNGFYPPLGLECVASALRPYCRAIDVIDLRHEKGNSVDFLRPDTDLVCFSVNWDREAGFVHQQIRSVPPGIRTIVGGRHVTQNPEPWLSQLPNIDIVVRGDGEEVVGEIGRGRPLKEIAGISYPVADRGSPIRPTNGRGPLPTRLVHDPVRQRGPHGRTSTRTGASAATPTRSIREA